MGHEQAVSDWANALKDGRCAVLHFALTLLPLTHADAGEDVL